MHTEIEAGRELDSEERPWGAWHVLFVREGYKVKRILVNPGHRLSYQTHEHRDEQPPTGSRHRHGGGGGRPRDQDGRDRAPPAGTSGPCVAHPLSCRRPDGGPEGSPDRGP